MTGSRWQPVPPRSPDPKADVQFVSHEGFPQGIAVLKEGEIALNDFRFRDGTIEFDLKPLGADLPGIRFRQKDRGNAEEFYMRTFPECRASNDCIQYTPVIHGFMLWNVYPQYQTAAPIFDGWNHIKLVISGRRMRVFVNRPTVATLDVGELASEASEGGIELRGPAAFANLVITPNAVEGLPTSPSVDPDARDRHLLRRWQMSLPRPVPEDDRLAYAQMPAAAAPWKRIDAERGGLVNVNRQLQSTEDAPALVWLKTSLASDSEQKKRVSMGWIGHAWIFVNGTLVTQGKNFYYPEAERRDPDGRLSLENGTFDLPLRKGVNEIAIALYSATHDDRRPRTRYGWGIKLRCDDLRGVALPGLQGPSLAHSRRSARD